MSVGELKKYLEIMDEDIEIYIKYEDEEKINMLHSKSVEMGDLVVYIWGEDV